MTEINPHKPSGFLSLPVEIRLQIYRYLKTPRIKNFTRGKPKVILTDHGFHSAILCTNRQVSLEARTILWGENVWSIGIHHESSSSYCPNPLILSLKQLHMASSMRRFHIYFRLLEDILEFHQSYGFDRFLCNIYKQAVVVLQALAQLPNIQIVISWSDELKTRKFEEKKWVLNALKVLPGSCVYRAGSVRSASNDVSTAEFSAHLDSVMRARVACDFPVSRHSAAALCGQEDHQYVAGLLFSRGSFYHFLPESHSLTV